MSTKNNSALEVRKAFVQPAARFVTDFTRLMKDMDQLMVDIRTVTEKERMPAKSNGDGRKPALDATISALREHARTFVKSPTPLRTLLNRVPVPYLELDEKARILRTNEECAAMLNGSATPLIGKSLFSFVARSDVKRFREHLEFAGQTNKPRTIALSIVHAGKHYPVELRMRRQPVGSDVTYVAVLHSADQLRNPRSAPDRTTYELALNLSRAQTLSSVGDAVGEHCAKLFGSPAGMVFVEHDGDLQLVSMWPSRQVSMKHPAQEMIKKSPVARAFRTGEPIFWHKNRDHHSTVGFRDLSRLLLGTRRGSVAFLPINATGQSPVGVLVMVLPQTDGFALTMRDDLQRFGEIVSGCIERARTYDKALVARVTAESSILQKDEFLSVLSHELKNPMMPILGWAVALSSGTLSANKQNLALDGIVRNVRALNYLIEDLFDAARISSGKLRLQPSEIRIQEIVREVLTSIQPNAEAKKLRVSTDISEAIPPFLADPRRVRQALMNLVNNAVKFTPGGGSVSLKVFRRGDNVECIVSDTGRGIEPKFLPLVFERFSQENRFPKDRSSGLGLGLAIVHEIVQLHGGSIKAYSDGTDKGSTFILRLPMRRRQTQSK